MECPKCGSIMTFDTDGYECLCEQQDELFSDEDVPVSKIIMQQKKLKMSTPHKDIPTRVETGFINNVSTYGSDYSIQYADSKESVGGWTFGFSGTHGVVPKVGDSIVVYTKSNEVIGVDLNGSSIYLKSDEQLDKERQDWLENYEREKQDAFEKNKDSMDKDYEGLPGVFKARIDRFRANNPNFRIEYEAYELFCCKEAVKIATALSSRDQIVAFKELDWEHQLEEVPELSEDHSGNTFGCACTLAELYLVCPDHAVIMHGALSPLVGSKSYGDIPLTKEETV